MGRWRIAGSIGSRQSRFLRECSVCSLNSQQFFVGFKRFLFCGQGLIFCGELLL